MKHVTTSIDAVHYHTRRDARRKPQCEHCDSRDVRIVHRDHRIIRDLDLHGKKVTIRVETARVCCCACQRYGHWGYPWLVKGTRATRRFQDQVFRLAQHLDLFHTAEFLDIHEETVRNLDKAACELRFGKTDAEGVTQLAVDEKAIRKGHRYMTVVLALDEDRKKTKVLDCTQDRTEQSLRDILEPIPEETRQGIEAVALDMWRPYENAVRGTCSNAKLVFDRFHVMKKVNQAIDDVRRDEWRQADKEQKSVIKGSRYLLLKHPDRLSDNGKQRLEKVLELNEHLNTAYVAGEQVRSMYESGSVAAMKEALDDTCRMLTAVELPPLSKLAATLRSHEAGILAYAEYGISTGQLEGLNNKISALKRRAYGYRDFAYFRLKVKQLFAFVPLRPSPEERLESQSQSNTA